MKNTIEKIKDLTYGVEIETLGVSQTKAVKVLEEVTGGRGTYIGHHLNDYVVKMPDGRDWKVVSDASLNGVGAEIVTPIMKYEDIPMVQEVLRGLRRAGGEWDSSTGLHVHVGASDMSAFQLANLAKIFYKQETLILKAAGTQQRRIARYTRRTDACFIERVCGLGTDATMRDLNAAWFGYYRTCVPHYDQSRYRALNYNNILSGDKPTVEFRFFEGTGHAGILRADILLALTMVAFAKEAKAASAKHQREYNEESAKFDFRTFTLRLGWIGEEFKNPRKHLMKNLPGDAAFRHGRPLTANA